MTTFVPTHNLEMEGVFSQRGIVKGEIMDMQIYRENRARFSEEALRPFDGQWTAFSSDGSRIVASSTDLQTLHQLVRAAGENPETVWYERIVWDDAWQGGGLELE